MSRTRIKNEIIARRGELLAELFLQDLDPEFLARPSADFGYNYLVGFRNREGGTNNIAVEVKTTEQPATGRFPISKQHYNRWAHSNIPVLLMVIDVKKNRYYHAWVSPEVSRNVDDAETIGVELTEITDATRPELLEKLRGPWIAVPR